MNVECVICHDHVRIPVRFTCFPCSRQDNDHRTCHSILRACMYCADQYLHLNHAPRDRPLSKRCLTCSTLVHPRSIHFKADAYVKDYLLMSLDTAENECPNSVLGCLFTGKQCELDRHLKDSCDYRLVQCPGRMVSCGSYRISEEEAHKRVCVRYRICTLCDEAVLHTDLESHMLTQHQMVECKHCRKMYKQEKIEEHAGICIQRPVTCMVCSTKLPICMMPNHIGNHVRTMTTRMHKIENALVEKYNSNTDSVSLQTAIKELSDNIIQHQQMIHKIRLTVKFNAAGIKI